MLGFLPGADSVTSVLESSISFCVLSKTQVDKACGLELLVQNVCSGVLKSVVWNICVEPGLKKSQCLKQWWAVSV